MVNVIFLLIKAKYHEYTLDCNLKEIKDMTLRKIMSERPKQKDLINSEFNSE